MHSLRSLHSESMSGEANGVLYFNDVISMTKNNEKNEEDKDVEETAVKAFYELANAPIVGYRVGSKRKKEIRIKQDSTCQTHTGGIVWETAYLLMCYLEMKSESKADEESSSSPRRRSFGKVLEVGSGCGMLGLALSASKFVKKVIMTETADVMPNLVQNLEFNLKAKQDQKRKKLKSISNSQTSSSHPCACCKCEKVAVRKLDWTKCSADIRQCQQEGGDGSSDLDPHSFDTIIGTDVIFSTELVKPLLKTLRKMAHCETQIYLCVQIRCVDSHAMFLKFASKYGMAVMDRTDDLSSISELQWGLALDCKILNLHVLAEENAVLEQQSKVVKKKRKWGK